MSNDKGSNTNDTAGMFTIREEYFITGFYLTYPQSLSTEKAIFLGFYECCGMDLIFRQCTLRCPLLHWLFRSLAVRMRCNSNFACLVQFIVVFAKVNFLFLEFFLDFSLYLIRILMLFSRFDLAGIYVVMFLEIFKTLIKVILVFSFILVAFSLSFFVLMRHEVRDVLYLIVLSVGIFVSSLF